MNIWNLLPPALVTRAKGIVAAVAAVLYIVVSYIPSAGDNHYVAIAIGILTALGVWAVPNSNTRSRGLATTPETRAGIYAAGRVLPTEKTLAPPSGYYAPVTGTGSTYNSSASSVSDVRITYGPTPEETPGEPG